uniref:Uncharacterized protein n=1 Tax=Oryza nivara TaxID=4536 RepID=A0A0E0G662_ORYNI
MGIVRNSCGLQCGSVQWPSKPSPTKTRRRTTKQQSCTFRGYRKINWQTATAATWWPGAVALLMYRENGNGTGFLLSVQMDLQSNQMPCHEKEEVAWPAEVATDVLAISGKVEARAAGFSIL